MAELNKIRFLLLILLMFFPAHALDVIFSRADEDFKQKLEINTNIQNGQKIYYGTMDPLTYPPKTDASKVIVYIIERSRFVEIIRNAVRETRLQIAQELSEWHYELVFLGIDNFDDDEYHLISAFMFDKFRWHPNQTNVTIETIGEHHFDRAYPSFVIHFEVYQEKRQICGGTLQKRLRDIPRGALRPAESNPKIVKLYGFHPIAAEAVWPVNMINNTYFPEVNVSRPKYNFRIRYKTKKICLLVLDGNKYLTLTSYGNRSTLREKMSNILDKMTMNNEGLYILGAFNFDWTEVDIVTQIILKHSEGLVDFEYNLFTYGYGMFNSRYRNVYVRDGRNILPQPKSNITDLIEELLGGEVKEKVLRMYYSSYGWKDLEMRIELENGQYVASGRFKNYTFPWVNQKIAFIVYDSTASNDPVDIRMVYLSMEELKQSGIYVVGIEAINFGLDDMHIIAEWIDYHRGVYMKNSDREVIDSDQIAVLGGGIFDTLFQSRTTTYKTLFNTKKDDLKKIREYFVNSGNGKRVFAANIDNPKFEVWTYSMNTINGFHEPDLIPDKNMFDTTDGKNIIFIITSAYRFHHISTVVNVENVENEANLNPETLGGLKKRIWKQYPHPKWSIFLVGLDNFGERDYHLFAELVKRQIHDSRSMQEIVRMFNCDIGNATYQYKDAPPFLFEDNPRILSSIKFFFRMTLRHADATSSHRH